MRGAAPAAAEAEKRRDHEQNQEDKEQNLCHLYRNRRYTAKSKQPGNDGDNQKCYCPRQHDGIPFITLFNSILNQTNTRAND